MGGGNRSTANHLVHHLVQWMYTPTLVHHRDWAHNSCIGRTEQHHVFLLVEQATQCLISICYLYKRARKHVCREGGKSEDEVQLGEVMLTFPPDKEGYIVDNFQLRSYLSSYCKPPSVHLAPISQGWSGGCWFSSPLISISTSNKRHLLGLRRHSTSTWGVCRQPSRQIDLVVFHICRHEAVYTSLCSSQQSWFLIPMAISPFENLETPVLNCTPNRPFNCYSMRVIWRVSCPWYFTASKPRRTLFWSSLP